MSNDEKRIKTMFENSSEIMLVMVVDITSSFRETTVSRTIRHNIEVAQNEINELQRLENSLEQKINMKRNSKKLSIF